MSARALVHVARATLLGNLLNKKNLILTIGLPLLVVLLAGALRHDDRPVIGVVGGESARGAVGASLDIRPYSSVRDLEEAVASGAIGIGIVVSDTRSVTDLVVPASGGSPALVAAAPAVAAGVDPALDDGVGPRSRPVGGVQWAGSANLALLLFANAIGMAAGLVQSRASGCHRRMLVASCDGRIVALGDLLGRAGVAVVQGALIVGLTGALLHVRWGSLIGVALIVVPFALVSAACGQLVGSVARTRDQVAHLGPLVAVGLGMTAGCTWSLQRVPTAMRAIGHAAPHAWAVDGLELLGAGRPLSAVVVPFIVLALAAAGIASVSVHQFVRATS